MKQTKFFTLIICVILFFSFAPFAIGDMKVDLYIFNRSFSGKAFAVKSGVYVEAIPLFTLLKATAKVQSAGKISVSWGKKKVLLDSITRGKDKYVPLKETAMAFSLSYDYNPQTGIADLYKPQSSQEVSSTARMPGNTSYDVEVESSHEEKGIDEVAVVVTVANKGVAVPGVVVTCNFTDQNDPTEQNHVFDKQVKVIENFGSGQSATIVFTTAYPNKSLSGSYRDYDTNVGYTVSLNVVTPNSSPNGHP